MNQPTLDADLAFQDLCDAYSALQCARSSPKEVRRLFSRYVEHTQRLTYAMRRDFSSANGATWEAKCFPGWNQSTEFIKWLRNEHEHGRQIYISVHERHFYRIAAADERLLVFEGTWVLADQMSEGTPEGITFHLIDPGTGQPLAQAVPPVRVEYQYLLQPRTEEATKRLRSVGTPDVHLIAETSLPVFREYHAFFREQIAPRDAGA